MPYTKRVNRVKFKELILSNVDFIIRGPDSQYVQGEYFAYWTERILFNFVGGMSQAANSFNANTFNLDKLKILNTNADKISALLSNHNDPMSVAGDINYSISSVYWGILGDAADVPEAGYGFRAYLKGSLQKILRSIEQEQGKAAASQKEYSMRSRRVVIASGVLSDIIDECYAIKTRRYEDKKISENGLLWEDGKLILPEEE